MPASGNNTSIFFFFLLESVGTVPRRYRYSSSWFHGWGTLLVTIPGTYVRKIRDGFVNFFYWFLFNVWIQAPNFLNDRVYIRIKSFMGPHHWCVQTEHCTVYSSWVWNLFGTGYCTLYRHSSNDFLSLCVSAEMLVATEKGYMTGQVAFLSVLWIGRSGSGLGSKRCRSTCRSYPQFLHMLENWEFLLNLFTASVLKLTTFFFSHQMILSNLTNFREKTNKKVLGNWYRCKMLRIRTDPDPDPQHFFVRYNIFYRVVGCVDSLNLEDQCTRGN
jgi:hypothetical protein